jgi:hypothetical protein
MLFELDAREFFTGVEAEEIDQCCPTDHDNRCATEHLPEF